jgi:radical SAM protein with 4Fe4S-binding SPASM domain
MPNILLTNYCNRACAYCFAEERIDHKAKPSLKKMEMPLENLAHALDVFERSGVKRFGIVGGEPTLHSRFQEVMEMTLSRGFSASIFTNGIMSDEKRAYLAAQDPARVRLVINVNHPDENPPAHWTSVTATFRADPRKTLLGFNLYRQDARPHFMLDLIREHGLVKEVRLGVALPIYGGHNTSLPVLDYPKLAEPLMDFVRRGARDGVRVNFDCGFVVCGFTQEQIQELAVLGSPFKSTCAPYMDIGPDLEVWHCFPLSEVMVTNLRDFQTIDELKAHYLKLTSPFRTAGSIGACQGCQYLEDKSCTGGCIAHKLSVYKGPAPLPEKRIPIAVLR